MQRLARLLACLVLVLLLGIGSVAHATEGPAASAAAESVGLHLHGDLDELPGQIEKGAPHQHGSCHGHHVAAPAEDLPPLAYGRHAALLTAAAPAPLSGDAAAPALRPPRT